MALLQKNTIQLSIAFRAYSPSFYIISIPRVRLKHRVIWLLCFVQRSAGAYAGVLLLEAATGAALWNSLSVFFSFPPAPLPPKPKTTNDRNDKRQKQLITFAVCCVVVRFAWKRCCFCTRVLKQPPRPRTP